MTVDKQTSPESVGAISWTTRMGTGVPFSSPLRRVRARGSGVLFGWKTTPRIRRQTTPFQGTSAEPAREPARSRRELLLLLQTFAPAEIFPLFED